MRAILSISAINTPSTVVIKSLITFCKNSLNHFFTIVLIEVSNVYTIGIRDTTNSTIKQFFSLALKLRSIFCRFQIIFSLKRITHLFLCSHIRIICPQFTLGHNGLHGIFHAFRRVAVFL